LSGKVYEALNQQNAVNIVDVGGDEIGSAVIGQFRELFSKKGYNLFYVVNIYRPFNSTKEEILENMKEILLSETKPEDILKSLEVVQDVANARDIPYVLTVVEEKLFEQDLLEEIKKYSLVYAIKRYIIR